MSRYEHSRFGYSDVETFVRASGGIESGLHSVSCGDDIWLDMLVHNRDAPTTCVVFNGAGFPNDMRRPGFSVTGVMGEVAKRSDVNAVFVHDPTLYAAPSLGLAWYAGARGLEIQGVVQQALQAINEKIGRSSRRIYFGVSGGGFAALFFSHADAGSLALATIPQTRLAFYEDWALTHYLSECWGTTAEQVRASGFESLGIVGDLVRIYEPGHANKAVVVANASDFHHTNAHLWPFIEAVSDGTVQTVVRNWGPGHSGPPPDLFVELISRFANAPNWRDLGLLAASRRYADKQELERDIAVAIDRTRPIEVDPNALQTGFEFSTNPLHGTFDLTLTYAAHQAWKPTDARVLWTGPREGQAFPPFGPRVDAHGRLFSFIPTGVAGRSRVRVVIPEPVASTGMVVELPEGVRVTGATFTVYDLA